MAKFEKGRKKTGGRKAGVANIPYLEDGVRLYEKRGGLTWLEEWVDESPLNKRKFMETVLAIALKQVTEKQEHSGEVTHALKFDFGENGEKSE